MVSVETIRRFPSSRDYLIPILQAVQEEEGYISKDSIGQISDYLGLPESKLFGVATVDTQFRLRAPGTLQMALGIKPGETTRDGLFSLETVACIGACSIAPVMTVNGEFYGRLDKKAVEKIIRGIRE